MSYSIDFSFGLGTNALALDYQGLEDNDIKIIVPIYITNNYTDTLWFKVELISPGGNYSNYSHELGSLSSGESEKFSDFYFYRVIPSSKITDSLVMRVTAYTDAYSTELNHKDMNVPFYYIDHDFLTIYNYEPFTYTCNWIAHSSPVYYDTTKYYSPPCSGRFRYTTQLRKNINIVGKSEAYLTIHTYKESINHKGIKYIVINNKPILLSTESLYTDNWYRYTIKLPTEDITEPYDISIYFYTSTTNDFYVDDFIISTIG